jgi:hypothetical protein
VECALVRIFVAEALAGTSLFVQNPCSALPVLKYVGCAALPLETHSSAKLSSRLGS